MKGFTLLEILVALAIFALLTAISYTGLNAVLDSREQLAAENQKWRDLALVFGRLEQDIANAAPRSIRDSSGLNAPALAGQQNRRNVDEPQLALTRTGFAGRAGNLAALQRVGYRLKERNLEQLVYPVLDQAPLTLPQALPLASGISAFQLRYLDARGAWQPNWPVAGIQDAMPAAVEVAITLAPEERITRIFLLP
jgi:general secretion pathway protein J